jgi:hypothetical protein
MSLFTEYEKLKTVRKSLPIGSKWEIVESTEGYYGCNTLGGIVNLVKVTSTDVGYAYSSYIVEPLTHFRSIETFKRTFRSVL